MIKIIDLQQLCSAIVVCMRKVVITRQWTWDVYAVAFVCAITDVLKVYNVHCTYNTMCSAIVKCFNANINIEINKLATSYCTPQ